MKLLLAAVLGDEIASAANTAFPGECCGLIEGVEDGGNFQATVLYPARNLAAAPDRFEIDPSDRIAAAKAARGRGHSIIGCYHSHPNGNAEPSPHDLAGAEEENFLWLIAATDGVRTRLAGFVYRSPGFVEVGLSRVADLVISPLNSRGRD
jgi:proteasome lid subunit RPN8/RPN11